MAISLRLEKKLDNDLSIYARITGKSKSEVVRHMLREGMAAYRVAATPWELGKDLFGREGSGEGNRSVTRKTLVRQKLHAKKNRG